MRTIDDNLIEQVKEDSDIVGIVSEDIDLIKKGANYLGLCPFHDDQNNPSFTVSPDKKIYKCFTCGAGGNVITFMQKYHHLTFNEAMVDLSKRLGITVKQRNNVVKNPAHYVLEDTTTYYETVLKNLATAASARDYLTNRGYSIEMLEHFHLGFAPREAKLHDYLVKQSQANENYSIFDIEQANVVTGTREFFANRLVIPIFDDNNLPVGFSGRGLGDETPKYLNSRDSDVFQKKNVLYNLNNAKRYASDHELIFVEGFFDVFALAKQDVLNVVGLMGTAFTSDHVNLLKKYKINKVVMILDQDKAGVESTMKVSELLIKNNITNIKVVRFDKYKDIDEYIIDNQDVSTLIKNAIDYFEFKLTELKKISELNSISDKSKFINYFKSNLRIAKPEEKVFMVSMLASSVGIEVSQLEAMFEMPSSKKQPIVNQPVDDYNQPSDNYEQAPVDYDQGQVMDYPAYDDSNYQNYDTSQASQPPSYQQPLAKPIINNANQAKVLTDEDVCIAYSLKGSKEYKKVAISYAKGYITFARYKDLYDGLTSYYQVHDEFNLIDFIDHSHLSRYFELCQSLIDNKFINYSEIDKILDNEQSHIIPGLGLMRGKRL